MSFSMVFQTNFDVLCSSLFSPMKIIIPKRDHIQTYAYILCIGHLGTLRRRQVVILPPLTVKSRGWVGHVTKVYPM